jgi:hypothetical protein
MQLDQYKKLLVVLALFFLLNHFDLNASIRKYDEAVSLGSICQPAWHLKANGVRKGAYPFDRVITPFHALIPFIAQRGAGFLEKDHLKILEVLYGEHTSYEHVVDLAYDIHFIHDFHHPDMCNYDNVKAKYERRVQRFFELLESDKKILFVRVQMNRHEAQILDDLLHSQYPHLEYTLVAISDDPDALTDWGLERVRNFYMQQIPGDWRGDSQRWTEILSQFSVKSAKKQSQE